jgi:integrase
MTPDTRHLWRRGNSWYFRMPVPRPVQKQGRMISADGKPLRLIVKALGDSLQEARRKRDRLVVVASDLIDRAKAGATITAAEIKAAMDFDATSEMARIRREVATALLEGGRVPVTVPGLMEDWGFTHSKAVSEARADLDISETVDEILKRLGLPQDDSLRGIITDRVLQANEMGVRDAVRSLARSLAPPAPAASAIEGETISQAAEAWYNEMARGTVRETTLDGHKLRVRAFIARAGDIPLGSVTRAMAADFLTGIAVGRSNRTVNAYAVTMATLFKHAAQRGRFTGENPFSGQKRKADGESYSAFTNDEIKALLTALPREIRPTRHTPETALPWATLIAAYTGMRLEEIAQLTVADIQTLGSNGGTVIVFDIHNGDAAHKLKNESSARAIPMHSELVRAGLLDYIAALPKDGPLFPGLKRRASKGGKVGARLGELFRKRLIKLGMKRDGLCFHSFRHSVAGRLEAAAVSETDAARVLGHTVAGMSYGVYSSGPGLKRLAAVVEAIEYEGFSPAALKTV